MPWRWGPPNGRHSCLGLICLTSLLGGVVCFLLLSTWRPRSCYFLVVPLFLIAPPFYTIGGAISFCLLIITLCLSLLALSRVRRWTRLLLRDACLLPVLMSYDFWGFHMNETACLPAPPCLIRLALTRHASRDVIVPIVSLIVSPCVPSSLLAPSFRRDRRGGRLLPMRCLSCSHAVI